MKSSVQSVVWQECMREDMIGSKQSHEHWHHHHYGYQCRYWTLQNKQHFNPETPTRPRPSRGPAPPWTSRWVPELCTSPSETSVEKMKILKMKSIKKEKTWIIPPTPDRPRPQDWHHHDVMTFRKHFEQKWSRRDKNKHHQQSFSGSLKISQSEERISCVSCDLIGWEMWALNVKGGWVFYSVAEELLPPCGEQKYTHRFLQYIQTELQYRSSVRDKRLTRIHFSVNSGFW